MSNASRVAPRFAAAGRKRTRRLDQFIPVTGIRSVVHGLMITSDFALPGFKAEDRENDCTRQLQLVQSPAERLAANWDPRGAERIWRGRQGDGEELAIERDINGRLLFSYGARAKFLLDAQKETLECTPTSESYDWCRVLIGKIIPAIAIMRGCEGLHAAAVDSGTGVVAIMAPSGTGKSTLAAALMLRGWRLFADDQLTLMRNATGVVALPGSGHMNLARKAQTATDSLGQPLCDFSAERWMVAERVQTRPRRVEMLCLFERRDGLSLEYETLPSNPLPLSPYLLGLASTPERLRSQFTLLADLVDGARLVRVTAGLTDPPDSIAELLVSADRNSRELAGAAR